MMEFLMITLIAVLAITLWMRMKIRKAVEMGEDIAYTLLVINYTEVELRFSSERQSVQINLIRYE